MSYRLFLDDERIPQQVKWVEIPLGPWVVVRSYDEFVNTIKQLGLPEHISFDHDLSFEHYPLAHPNGGLHLKSPIDYDSYKEKTGMHCAKWLVEFCLDNRLKCPNFTVHSMNPVGARNIRSYLQSFILSQE